MYDRSGMKTIFEHIIYKLPGGLIYASDRKFERLEYKMDYLACFAGGLFLLGAQKQPYKKKQTKNAIFMASRFRIVQLKFRKESQKTIIAQLKKNQIFKKNRNTIHMSQNTHSHPKSTLTKCTY